MAAPLTIASGPIDTTAEIPRPASQTAVDGIFALELAECEASDEQPAAADDEPAPNQTATAQQAASILLTPMLDKIPLAPTVPNAAVPVKVEAATSTTEVRRIEVKQVRGELAFALRVSEQKATPAAVTPLADKAAAVASPLPEQPAPNEPSTDAMVQTVKATSQRPQFEKEITAPPSRLRKEGRSDAPPQSAIASGTAPSASAAAMPASSAAEPTKAFAAPRIAQPEAPRPIEAIQEPPKILPAKQIAVRVESPETAQAPAKSVDLVVEQRGSALHFAVRSADPVLTAELRNSLTDLTTRLDAQGLRSEVTRPAQIAVVAADGGFLRQSNDGFDQSHANDWSQGGGQGGNNGGQRDQSQQDRDEQHPEWLSEWEQGLFAPARATA